MIEAATIQAVDPCITAETLRPSPTDRGMMAPFKPPPDAHGKEAESNFPYDWDSQRRGPIPARLLPKLKKAARLPIPKLIEAETGAGKTHLAKLLHDAGPRSRAPFVRVDCTTLGSLALAELFGHERGAFTGASKSRSGAVQAAHRGTLFVDEIGEMPIELQPALLSALEGYVRHLGSETERTVDIQLIAATNRDLAQLVQEGKFRADLYHRCRGLAIRIPPLRNRLDEFPRIIDFLLGRLLGSDYLHSGRPPPTVTGAGLQLLRSHHWPGNIRELDFALKCAVAFSEGRSIDVEHLREALAAPAPAPGSAFHVNGKPSPGGKPNVRARYQAAEPAAERRMIVDALRAEGGRISRAAEKLGMSRQVMWERRHRYRIEEQEWKRPES